VAGPEVDDALLVDVDGEGGTDFEGGGGRVGEGVAEAREARSAVAVDDRSALAVLHGVESRPEGYLSSHTL
jgi:hypothetical protein